MRCSLRTETFDDLQHRAKFYVWDVKAELFVEHTAILVSSMQCPPFRPAVFPS